MEAEFWYANDDVWPGGGAIDAAFLRYLAFNGPWSIPRLAAMVQEYRPLIQSLSSDVDRGGENWAARGVPSWQNINGVTLAPHPPLAPGYRRPYDAIRPLVI
jgi:hypothetical protein